MKIGRKTLPVIDTLRWILTLRKHGYQNYKKIIDTFTAHYVIAKDPDSHDTFTDSPYLIPFIAEGSRQAVIVVPGGGYCLKEMENEGTKVANYLNSQGISAFVLWYRTCPYYQPVPLLDMQRAVRKVRALSGRYGYREDGIGAVGFSGGGAQIGLFLNILRGKDAFPAGYQKDEIDAVSDRLNFAGLIYPALGYSFNRSMQYASFPEGELDTRVKREEIEKKYNALANFSSRDVPQFVCYGTKDNMVSLEDIRNYAQLLEDSGTSHEFFPVEGAGHGFGAGTEKYNYWLREFTEWVKKL